MTAAVSSKIRGSSDPRTAIHAAEGAIPSAKPGIIGILVAGHNLVHPLPQQRQAGVPNPAALSGIAEMLVLFGRHILGLKTQLLLLAGIMRMSVTKFLVVDGATALLTVALFWGGIGLLGDDRIEKIKAEAIKVGHIAMVVFLIVLAGWICYKFQKKRIKKIISY